jgi:hypothetical protein
MILLVIFLAVPASSAVAATRDCGTVSGGAALYEIAGTGVGCSSARATAKAWRTRLFAGGCENGRFRCRVHGYTCRAKRPAKVHYPVTCRKGDKRVAWWIHAD